MNRYSVSLTHPEGGVSFVIVFATSVGMAARKLNKLYPDYMIRHITLERKEEAKCVME